MLVNHSFEEKGSVVIQASVFIDGEEATGFESPRCQGLLGYLYEKLSSNNKTMPVKCSVLSKFMYISTTYALDRTYEWDISSYYNDKGRVFEYKWSKIRRV